MVKSNIFKFITLNKKQIKEYYSYPYDERKKHSLHSVITDPDVEKFIDSYAAFKKKLPGAEAKRKKTIRQTALARSNALKTAQRRNLVSKSVYVPVSTESLLDDPDIVKFLPSRRTSGSKGLPSVSSRQSLLIDPDILKLFPYSERTSLSPMEEKMFRRSMLEDPDLKKFLDKK
ncbi:MAG TPA: hypothetical protein V6C58_14895 [Allocoleopsis sp.]